MSLPPRPVLRRVLGPVLASVVGAALLTTAAHGPAAASSRPAAAPAAAVPPGSDPFYTPPSPLPDGRPGDLIRSRPAAFTVDPLSRSPYPGVSSWQVLYRSENAHGAPIAVSGIVLVPDAPWNGPGARPLVSYAVGTRGLGDACAPSYTLTRGTDYEALMISGALDRGWAVAVTDMEGLGTPGGHTYEVGRSQGKAVLDMARAARRLPAAGLGDSPVAVWGYSQGGTSAGWAAQLAPSHAPELPIRGVFAGGVPADLRAVAEGLDGSPFVALMFMAAVGFDAAYPDLGLEKYLNDAGRRLLEEAKDMCLASVDGASALVRTAFRRIGDYTTSNPLDVPRWQRALDANRLGGTAPRVPVLQTHAVFDEIIPLKQASTLRDEWCAKGANVTWKTYTVAEHATGMLWSHPHAMRFIADRFAGKPAAGNCPD